PRPSVPPFYRTADRSTLRGLQSDNLSFKEDGMTRRSMPSSFHANLFALESARCPSSTYGVVPVGT
ncbi:MAG: hypothetical protein SOX49_02835, partial [Collinsella sp.]|nr:hypothetical protein [Collinsella sp.]